MLFTAYPFSPAVLSSLTLACLVSTACGGGGDATSTSAPTEQAQSLASIEADTQAKAQLLSQSQLTAHDLGVATAPLPSEEQAADLLSTQKSITSAAAYSDGAPVATSVTNSSAATSPTPIAAKPIAASDIRLQVEAANSFASYRWLWGMECDGQVLGALNIPEAGIHGADLGGGMGTQRFGKVADPDQPSRKVLMFRANVNDRLAAAAPRCEMTFSPTQAGSLPVKKELWFAFGVRLKDWKVTDDEQLLMQWHWGNGAIPLNPFLGLFLRGNTLRIDNRFDATYPPSKNTTTVKTLWQNTQLPIDRWTYFVIKARISPHLGDAPYVKVWRDGVQVASYSGPVGYNYPEVNPYVKVGHYQWIASYNPWSTAAPTKTVLYRTPSLIQDSAGAYTESDVRRHVMDR
ncbi:MAG: heparin lyase I family protein [Rubrivivax sp.]|nr:heparin lyase I family protein [Rubrivivax sp.]